jgi:hypothetical protein
MSNKETKSELLAAEDMKEGLPIQNLSKEVIEYLSKEIKSCASRTSRGLVPVILAMERAWGVESRRVSFEVALRGCGAGNCRRCLNGYAA